MPPKDKISQWMNHTRNLGGGPQLAIGRRSSHHFMMDFYCSKLKQEGRIDFPDMLRLASRILEEHADIRDVVKNCQRHILVDEFQDVSSAQFEVLKHLIREPVRDSSLTTVGDDDQIIYSWNGATIEIFAMLQRQCGRDTNQVQLIENYRSSACILDIGRTILTDNELR